MSQTVAGDEPVVSEDAMDAVGKRTHFYLELEGRVAAGLLDLCKNSFWMYAVEVTGMFCFRTDDGWLAMLKGVRTHKRVVAYFNGPTYATALELMVTSVDSKHVSWWPDRKANQQQPEP